MRRYNWDYCSDRILPKSIPGMGILGAIVGGTNAIAKNAELLRAGSISQTDAALDTGKEALKNGVATALTFAVVGAVTSELAVSIGVTLVLGTTLKYLSGPRRRLCGSGIEGPGG